MHVLIDKERLLILRKLDQRIVLSKLADLEHPHRHVAICYADEVRDFNGFTDLELKLLIKNAAGPDVRHVFARETLQQILLAMVQTLPVDVVNGFEVDMQLRSLGKDDTEPRLYVRGSTKPAPATGLEEVALKYAGGGGMPPPSPANAVPLPTPAAQAPSAPRAPQSDGFVEPKEGTSTHKIFSMCTKLWREAGCEDSKRVLDDVKRKVLEILEKEGLNANTIRTQATRWYHNRQRLVD